MPCFLLNVAGIFDYARPVGRGRFRAIALPGRPFVTMPAAAPASPPARKLGRNRLPFHLDREDDGSHRRFVGPVLWIETMHTVHQPVAVLRGARTPADPQN
jgi:hypothetical protein